MCASRSVSRNFNRLAQLYCRVIDRETSQAAASPDASSYFAGVPSPSTHRRVADVCAAEKFDATVLYSSQTVRYETSIGNSQSPVGIPWEWEVLRL